MKAKYVDQKTIVTTREGIEILEAGDITEAPTAKGTDVRQLHGAPRTETDERWNEGRPLEVITNEKKFVVRRSRMNNRMGDMDSALPRDVLARRKKLVLDRMKQERRV